MNPEEPIELPLAYTDVEETPILYANHFHIQHAVDGFFLTVGQLQQPLLLGTPEQQREQARQLTYVPIKIVARYAIAPTHLKELIAVLEENLRKWEQKDG